MLGCTGDEELDVADFGVLVVLHLTHLLLGVPPQCPPAENLLQNLKNRKREGVRILRSRAHRRDRLDASFHRMCSAPQDSKCSSQKTDSRECEGYLYPPQKKLTEEALSEADFNFEQKIIMTAMKKR